MSKPAIEHESPTVAVPVEGELVTAHGRLQSPQSVIPAPAIAHGCLVRVQGLIHRTDLNDCWGLVVGEELPGGRWPVRLSGEDKSVSMAAVNLSLERYPDLRDVSDAGPFAQHAPASGQPPGASALVPQVAPHIFGQKSTQYFCEPSQLHGPIVQCVTVPQTGKGRDGASGRGDTSGACTLGEEATDSRADVLHAPVRDGTCALCAAPTQQGICQDCALDIQCDATGWEAGEW